MYRVVIFGSNSMVFTSAPARRHLSFISTAVPWFILGLALLATGIGWDRLRESQLRNAETEFKLHSERATVEMRRRLLAYEQVLRGGAALFSITGSISRAQWRGYTDRLRIGESFPGIQGIGFAKIIAGQELPEHVLAVRAEGFPHYDVRPEGVRANHAPITYLEPFTGRNLRAFGYDMFSEPIRRAAMERARDHGATAISGKIRLMQETEEIGQAGFLMYVPVYRGGKLPQSVEQRRIELVGYIFAPFRMNDFMAGALDAAMDDIDLEIFDGTEPAPETLLFDRDKIPRFPDNKTPAAFSLSSVFDNFGRAWTLRYEASPTFLASRADQQPFLLLAGGAFISLLLFGLTWLMSRAGATKLALAEQVSATSHESEKRYAGIFHSAMDAIITIDEKQNVLLFNPAAEQIFRCTAIQALGAPLTRFIPERYRDLHYRHVEHFSATGVSDRQMGEQRDLLGLRADGEEFPLEASISQTTQNGKKLYTVMLRDITSRKHAETALRNSEQRFRRLIEVSPEAIYIHQDEKIIFVNNATLALFGAAGAEQLIGKSIYSLFQPDLEGSVRQTMESLLTGVLPTPILERKIVRFDGEIRFVEVAVSVFVDAGKHAFQEIMRDVTDRHLASEELERSHSELRQLSVALETAQEEVRMRIARELHDDLGQHLTVLKMDMSSLKLKLKSDPSDPVVHASLLEDIERMDSLLNQTVQSTRRISADLRPLLLDDLGLATALEVLIKQVSRSSNINCSFSLDPDRLSIDQRLGTPLYRIAQEALNNIVKHAQATEVTLSLYRDATNCLILEIRDNGKGIAPESRRKAASFGLIGMRERVYALGGKIQIESQPGTGTKVRVSIPNSGNVATTETRSSA